MANTLGAYNETFFAQEALIQLEKGLGLASRVHMGYDEERKKRAVGDTIRIRRPSTFTAQTAPNSAKQDLKTEYVDISLTSWQEVRFSLTDAELAYTQEKIIQDHIRPAAYALADKIDRDGAALYKGIPWVQNHGTTSDMAIADITNTQQILFDNAVPLIDEENMFYMVGGVEQNKLLQLPAFTQANTGGQQAVENLRRGRLNRAFGFEFFANQNRPTHTAGALADASGTLDATTVALHSTTLVVNAVTNSGTVKKGDSLIIAGDTQRYAITADATATGGGVLTVTIDPPLRVLHTTGDVVTIDVEATKTRQNIAFHRNAFALGFAELSELGNQLGAKISTVRDPVTGLSLRVRMYYDGDASAVVVVVDTLYGWKNLDPNLACRSRS